jgi:hypothetical protein
MTKLLTVQEAAEQLGTSVRFVRRLIAERRIAYVRSAATFASPKPTWRASWRPGGWRPAPDTSHVNLMRL